MTRLFLGCLAAAAMTAASPVLAQTRASAAGEPLELGALQRAALAADARGREVDLLSQQADLRLRNLDVERRPSVSVLG